MDLPGVGLWRSQEGGHSQRVRLPLRHYSARAPGYKDLQTLTYF